MFPAPQKSWLLCQNPKMELVCKNGTYCIVKISINILNRPSCNTHYPNAACQYQNKPSSTWQQPWERGTRTSMIVQVPSQMDAIPWCIFTTWKLCTITAIQSVLVNKPTQTPTGMRKRSTKLWERRRRPSTWLKMTKWRWTPPEVISGPWVCHHAH